MGSPAAGTTGIPVGQRAVEAIAAGRSQADLEAELDTVLAMPLRDWIQTVEARSMGRRSFAARRRKNPVYGPPSEVEHVQFDFRQWDGPLGPWAEHFGKGRGQVHSLDGAEPLRSCNEVEVAKRLRKVRDHAFWFSGYNPTQVPEIWQPWMRSYVDMPDWLTALDAKIRKRIRSQKGGMPDVVGWNDHESLRSALFIECKGPREKFSEAQEDWVWAARRAGVRPSQIAVSLRPF
jgi:hypothetical protein